MDVSDTSIERHPLKPFLPDNARILLLGSFPPDKKRWSMDFFYPNCQNDMWRIMGLVFFDDKNHFVTADNKHFDKDKIIDFCSFQGIAVFDVAVSVRRMKGNASDAFLEIVEKTDLEALLASLPQCRTVAATGRKAAETVAASLSCDKPEIGRNSSFTLNGCKYAFYRMPSSSRAYPLRIEQKASVYKNMLIETGLIQIP